jgi:hypothetical protein
MTATLHTLRPTHRTVRLVRLDGTEFARAGFPVSGPPDPGAPWAWIVETVAAELGVPESQVGCLEPDNDEDGGGDYVTVDGLPVYRVDILRPSH